MAESHSQFREDLPVKALLSSVFQRLKLKDDDIQVFLPASDAGMEEYIYQ